MICGEANKNGNIQLTYLGGCRKHLKNKDAYRCTGCGGHFHKECILKHFELEKEHDYGRQKEREEIKIRIHKKYHKGITEKEILNLIK